MQLQALDVIPVVNLGVGSATLFGMQSDAATQIDAAYAVQTRRISYVVCWGGTNDMFEGVDAATTYSRLLTYLAARRAAGWRTVVVTTLPRSFGSPPPDFETQRQAFNALIRGDATKYDAIADVAADSRIGDAGDELNTTYYADKVHLTNAGYAIIAAAVHAAIGSIP